MYICVCELVYFYEHKHLPKLLQLQYIFRDLHSNCCILISMFGATQFIIRIIKISEAVRERAGVPVVHALPTCFTLSTIQLVLICCGNCILLFIALDRLLCATFPIWWVGYLY